MATESSGATTALAEAEDDGPSRGSEEYFDARLGPTCMMWFMVVGIGFLSIMIINWMIGNLGSIFR